MRRSYGVGIFKGEKIPVYFRGAKVGEMGEKKDSITFASLPI